jgi:acetyltransferase-like isoleucine patch superfamily enzyme
VSVVAAPRAAFADRRRRRRLAADMRRVCFPAAPERFRAFGEGSVIAPPARIDAPQWIAIGRDTVIHEHAFLTLSRQEGGPEPLLEIGDRVRIGRFGQISVTGHVVIEDDVLISDEVHIGDTYHRYDVPGLGAQHQPLTEPGPVRIARGALVNFGAVILHGVTVGEEAYVHAGAVVTRDVAPRTAVIGAPARPVAASAGVWA